MGAVGGLAAVVACAGGHQVGRRGSPPPPVRERRRLWVGPVDVITLPAGRPMVAQHDDGATWRRHWSTDGRLVVEFVDVAVIAVDDDGTITVDRPLDPELEDHLVLDHVLPLVLAFAGHVVLHGGVISLDDRAVALVGASGAGKSTLAGHAWVHGWTLGNDDGVVLRADGDRLWAEPTYATLRLSPDGAELAGVDPAGAAPIVGKLRIGDRPGRRFRPEPTELVAVAVLVPDPDASAARFEPLAGLDAHAELFGSTFHADFASDRQLPGVLTVLADAIERATVGRLRVPFGPAGLASADAILRGLVTSPSGS